MVVQCLENGAKTPYKFGAFFTLIKKANEDIESYENVSFLVCLLEIISPCAHNIINRLTVWSW